MAQVATITTAMADVVGQNLAKLDQHVSRWDLATEKQRATATTKFQAVSLVLDAITQCHFKSVTAAVDGLLLRAKAAPQAYPQLLIGRGNTLVSRSTLLGYCTKANGSIENLLPKHKGSKPKRHAWETRALALYAHDATAANHPDAGTVMYQLHREGFTSVTTRQVRSVLNRYSKGQTDFAPNRVGRHYHRQNIGAHKHRDTSVLPVGHVYTGDGHACDVYVAHPANGHAWRPELTAWQCMRSNYITGWFISNAESAVTTLHSLAKAFNEHQHIPARLYVDKGSGFENKMISQGATSFLERMGIASSFSLPGNAKGKGLIEGWWRWFEFRCGKQFETYCGHQRTDDALRNLKGRIKKGEIVLPSLAEYETAIQEYIDWYNHQPQKRLGCSPAEMWATLEPVAPAVDLSDMVRPQYVATVSRENIRYKNRLYSSPVLAHFHKQKVNIEVDLNNDSLIVVRDSNGKLICHANLVERIKAVHSSIIEDDKARRLESQIKRLEVHKQEKIEQARPVLDSADFISDPILVDSASPDAIDITPQTTIAIEDVFNA